MACKLKAFMSNALNMTNLYVEWPENEIFMPDALKMKNIDVEWPVHEPPPPETPIFFSFMAHCLFPEILIYVVSDIRPKT